MRRFVELGKIAKPHGFRGDFVAHSHGGADSALSYLTQVYVGETPDTAQPFKVLEAAWMPKGWKLRLQGLESEEAVRRRQNQKIFVERELLKETESDEYYIADLEGASVWDWENQVKIGSFAGVECLSPSNQTPRKTVDRWWIQLEGDSVAIPAIKRFIHHFDAESKIIYLQNLKDLE